MVRDFIINTYDQRPLIKVCKVDKIKDSMPLFPLEEGDWSVTWDNGKFYVIKTMSDETFWYYELDEQARMNLYNEREIIVDNDVLKLGEYEPCKRR